MNNYRANTQLLAEGQVYPAGFEKPKLLEIDVRGELGGVREMLGEYIHTVKGGVITPDVDHNWKLVGNDCRHLLPASALFGAIFLLLVDNISRNLLATEIPIGILTAFVGAPFFLYLMTRKEHLL